MVGIKAEEEDPPVVCSGMTKSVNPWSSPSFVRYKAKPDSTARSESGSSSIRKARFLVISGKPSSETWSRLLVFRGNSPSKRSLKSLNASWGTHGVPNFLQSRLRALNRENLNVGIQLHLQIVTLPPRGQEVQIGCSNRISKRPLRVP